MASLLAVSKVCYTSDYNKIIAEALSQNVEIENTLFIGMVCESQFEERQKLGFVGRLAKTCRVVFARSVA